MRGEKVCNCQKVPNSTAYFSRMIDDSCNLLCVTFEHCNDLFCSLLKYHSILIGSTCKTLVTLSQRAVTPSKPVMVRAASPDKSNAKIPGTLALCSPFAITNTRLVIAKNYNYPEYKILVLKPYTETLSGYLAWERETSTGVCLQQQVPVVVFDNSKEAEPGVSPVLCR